MINIQPFKLNPIGLGTNRITNVKEAHDLLRFAVDQGINFIDTANVYQDGESELSIKQALFPYQKNLCIATKAGFKKESQTVYTPEGDPKKLRENLEKSLKRLQLDRIDLFQLHRIDPNVPLEESVGGLKDLQDEGKIRHIGLSEVTVEQIKRAQAIAPIVSVQNRYNVFERNYEDVVNFCENEKIVFIPFFPLGSARNLIPVEKMKILEQVASNHKATAQQVALAWLLNRSSFMLPIPGTLSKQHLSENLSAQSISLSKNEIEMIGKK